MSFPCGAPIPPLERRAAARSRFRRPERRDGPGFPPLLPPFLRPDYRHPGVASAAMGPYELRRCPALRPSGSTRTWTGDGLERRRGNGQSRRRGSPYRGYPGAPARTGCSPPWLARRPLPDLSRNHRESLSSRYEHRSLPEVSEFPPPRREADPPAPPTRRPYEGPRILHRETVEAMAADCSFPGGKSDPTCAVGFS